MNILIDTLRVSGFRGIDNLEISLPRVTVLIGTNNSGKTSVLKAMQLALGDYSRHLSEEDFYINVDNQRVTEILVDCRVISVNEEGKREPSFSEEWLTEFGDKIKSEANGNQYVALRCRSKVNLTKGGFDTDRFTLETWLSFDSWKTEKIKETRASKRFSSMPFIAIEAQRDIHQELREKSSFIGKVLSSVEEDYNKTDIEALEALIKEVNEEAVKKNEVLKNLESHLENLNQSFQGSGNAEITPFPKKIRDLSKYFSIYFGETDNNNFSMEYHGMGTRSWASMLAIKAFIDLIEAKHKEEVEPFFPILGAEEPEAHLHPNAQKTLYQQLASSQGQIIVSTHSPYLAAMAKQNELRYLKKSSNVIEAKQLDSSLNNEEKRRLHREIIHSRGEILFSKALVLCEGETEEQALPLLFERYFNHEAFVLGVSFISVGGSGEQYLPFLRFAKSLAIPIFIFSDGEERITTKLKKNYERVFGTTDVFNCQNITILDNTDFEGYLISSGFRNTIELAMIGLYGEEAIQNWIKKHDGKLKKGGVKRDYQSPEGYHEALIDILDSNKTKYAPAIAEKLCELEKEKLPPKFIELFENIKAGAGI
ncbi:MAG: AAA family ATPase [Methylococcales bacterium]|nr:AAA family ATPase [Methylococcales bacterium]